mmetsp:Transcript_4884/g.7851  ORF Transcript_4884/g.7851 Transcript_4884/m.7851 type:complete len:573 (+) Transcript_4884:891-2609(+)
MILRSYAKIYHGKSERNRGKIFCFVTQPYGNLCVSSGDDNILKLWFLTPFLLGYDTINRKEGSKFLPFSRDILFEGKIDENMALMKVIKWSKNGEKIATGGNDGSIYVYQNSRNPYLRENWRIYAVLKGSSTEVVDISWTKDSAKILSTTMEGKIILWDTLSKTPIMKISSRSYGKIGISWDPTDKFFASNCNNKRVIIWDTKEARVNTTFYLEKSSNNYSATDKKISRPKIFWSSCGKLILTSSQDCTFVVMNIKYSLGPILKKKMAKIFTPETSILSVNSKMFRLGNRIGINCLFSDCTTLNEISIWNLLIQRPILSINFQIPEKIKEIIWSENGYSLIIITERGKLIRASFTKNELRELILKKTELKILKKIHCTIFSDRLEKSPCTKISNSLYKLIFLPQQGFKKWEFSIKNNFKKKKTLKKKETERQFIMVDNKVIHYILSNNKSLISLHPRNFSFFLKEKYINYSSSFLITKKNILKINSRHVSNPAFFIYSGKILKPLLVKIFFETNCKMAIIFKAGSIYISTIDYKRGLMKRMKLAFKFSSVYFQEKFLFFNDCVGTYRTYSLL